MSRLKEIREREGFTQKGLAEVSGVSLRTLQKYESGERDLLKAEVGAVIALADALEVTVYELLGEGMPSDNETILEKLIRLLSKIKIVELYSSEIEKLLEEVQAEAKKDSEFAKKCDEILGNGTLYNLKDALEELMEQLTGKERGYDMAVMQTMYLMALDAVERLEKEENEDYNLGYATATYFALRDFGFDREKVEKLNKLIIKNRDYQHLIFNECEDDTEEFLKYLANINEICES